MFLTVASRMHVHLFQPDCSPLFRKTVLGKYNGNLGSHIKSPYSFLKKEAGKNVRTQTQFF